MRFLAIYKTAERNEPPTQDAISELGRLIDEMTKAGVLLATEGCQPNAKGARVRQSRGRVMVTDGPFTDHRVEGTDRRLCSVPGTVERRSDRLDQAIPRGCPQWRERNSLIVQSG